MVEGRGCFNWSFVVDEPVDFGADRITLPHPKL